MKINNFFNLNFCSNQPKRQYKSVYKMPEPVFCDEEEQDLFIKSKARELKENNPAVYNPIENIVDKIPKNILGAEYFEKYSKQEIDYEDFLRKCGIINIIDSIGEYQSGDLSSDEQVIRLNEVFDKNDVETSNYELALELVKEQKLHPASITFNKGKTRFNKQFISDMDKFFDAKIENKNIENQFIEKFKNRQNAAQKLETGEVCQIEGEENISIKLEDGSIEELFLTPKTYLELFPPVQRFAAAQNAEDCFLIAGINSLYKNPISRHLILEMFKENPDGTLDASLGGYKRENDEIVLKNKNSFELKDVEKNFTKEDVEDNFALYAHQFEGLRALELTARKDIIHNSYQSIKERYDIYSKAIKTLEKDDDFIEIDGEKHTKKEMELFLYHVEDDIEDEELATQLLIPPKDTFCTTTASLYKDQAEELINQFSDNKDLSKSEEYFFIQLKKALERANNKNEEMVQPDFIPFIYYNSIIDAETYADIDYIAGGTIAPVYEKIGLETKVLDTLKNKKDKKILKQILNTPDFNSKLVGCAFAMEENNNSTVIPYHAYSFRPEIIDGRKMIILTNPQNSAKDIILTEKEFMKNFTDFEFALIK